MLARQARQTALITVLANRPDMPLTQLICLVRHGKYARDLAALKVEALRAGPSVVLRVGPNESIEDAVLRVFGTFEDKWLSSGFFVRYLGLERWTAQTVCTELAERGCLERRGRTSGTRYRYAQGVP